jgi:DNA-binding transcriptional LysR family regulator
MITCARAFKSGTGAMDRVSSMLSFVKVVEKGGFSAAGRELNLSTSMVTTHVKSLEDRLGVRLLNRTTRNVSPTEAGHAYYDRCVQILSEMDDADEAVQTLQAKPRGTLRLNVSPAVPALIAPSVAEFTTLYDGVSVHLNMTSRMIDLVQDEFDLAIRVLPVAASSLIRRRLATFRFIAAATPEYIAKHGRPEHPSDLARHNCLIFYDASVGKGGKEWNFTGPDGDFAVHVSGSFETNSVHGLKAAAMLGQGLVLGPSFLMAEELKSGALVALLSEFLSTEYSVDALYPNRQYLPAKVRTFIEIVAKNFQQINWDPGAHEMNRPNRQVKKIV